MSNRSMVDTVITAAIVVVILPLFVAVAAVLASFGIEAAAGPGFGMFGPMGTPHLLMLGWTVVAIVIISSVVAVVAVDRHHHA